MGDKKKKKSMRDEFWDLLDCLEKTSEKKPC